MFPNPHQPPYNVGEAQHFGQQPQHLEQLAILAAAQSSAWQHGQRQQQLGSVSGGLDFLQQPQHHHDRAAVVGAGGTKRPYFEYADKENIAPPSEKRPATTIEPGSQLSAQPKTGEEKPCGGEGEGEPDGDGESSSGGDTSNSTSNNSSSGGRGEEDVSSESESSAIQQQQQPSKQIFSPFHHGYNSAVAGQQQAMGLGAAPPLSATAAAVFGNYTQPLAHSTPQQAAASAGGTGPNTLDYSWYSSGSAALAAQAQLAAYQGNYHSFNAASSYFANNPATAAIGEGNVSRSSNAFQLAPSQQPYAGSGTPILSQARGWRSSSSGGGGGGDSSAATSHSLMGCAGYRQGATGGYVGGSRTPTAALGQAAAIATLQHHQQQQQQYLLNSLASSSSGGDSGMSTMLMGNMSNSDVSSGGDESSVANASDNVAKGRKQGGGGGKMQLAIGSSRLGQSVALISYFEVYTTVPGRLAMLSHNVKYKVTLGEISRRIQPPECLNASYLGAILRKAKNKDGCRAMREDLHRTGLVLPSGRRKLTQVTTFTSLCEQEAATLATDYQHLSNTDFPLEELAPPLLYALSCANTANQYGGGGEGMGAKASREQRLAMVASAHRVVGEAIAIVEVVEKQVIAETIAPVQRQALSAEEEQRLRETGEAARDGLLRFSRLTHGFGNLAMLTAWRCFREVLGHCLMRLAEDGGTAGASHPHQQYSSQSSSSNSFNTPPQSRSSNPTNHGQMTSSSSSTSSAAYSGHSFTC